MKGRQVTKKKLYPIYQTSVDIRNIEVSLIHRIELFCFSPFANRGLKPVIETHRDLLSRGGPKHVRGHMPGKIGFYWVGPDARTMVTIVVVIIYSDSAFERIEMVLQIDIRRFFSNIT